MHLVTLKDQDVKGSFLGLEGFNFPYKALAFRIEEGDVLLLFTDCFNESKNAQGEEYGTERILDSFSRAPLDSPNDTIAYLMNDFYSFVGTENLHDDLTVVLMKRLV